MKLISVISPIYKVEDYLEKCVNSITSQTYRQLEIILVDDGSPDRCGEICDKLAAKDKRIKVIHKSNGGAASARNEGIKIASGEYFYFPDSDDWLEPTYLEELYETAEKTKAQLVISGYIMEYYENGLPQSYQVSVPQKDFQNQVQVRSHLQDYFDNMMMAVPWNKLYSADYIRSKNLLFPKIKWDDLHFNMEVIMDIEKVAISSSIGYHFFRSRKGSETTTVFDGKLYQKRKEQFQHILKVYDHWGTTDEDILAVIYGYYASRMVQCVQEVAISNAEGKKRLIEEILQEPLTTKAFERGKIQSRMLAIAALPMKHGSVYGSLVVGNAIGFVKNTMPSTFYKLKSTSVNKAKTNRKNRK